MADQVLHLKENNGEDAGLCHNVVPERYLVRAVMLNSATSKEEVEQTYEQLMNPPANGEQGIKLLYVTVSFHVIWGKLDINLVLSQRRLKGVHDLCDSFLTWTGKNSLVGRHSRSTN